MVIFQGKSPCLFISQPMKIILNQFIPNPLSELDSGDSAIWRHEHLTINPGSVNSIISESGKGKTSLLLSIYGIRKDYEGEILFDNRNISTFTAGDWSEWRQKKLSTVFQSLKLFPEISALENIQLKNQLQNHKSKAEINDMLSRLNMADFANQSAGNLSFGQQQRIAIIRALCQPFSVLLLDEPFSHLDKQNAQNAWELILEESKQQQAQIIITGLSETSFIQANQTFYI